MKSVIEEIVDAININISASFAESKYTGKRIYGLTEKNTKGGVTAPSTVESEKRPTVIFLDSKVPIILYHKNVATQFEIDEKKSFGRGLTERATHRMSIVAFTMKKLTSINQFKLQQLLQVAVMKKWSSAFKSQMALKSLYTQIDSCDLDAESVYKKEWVGVNDSTVITGAALIELQYKIVRTYKHGCEVNCCN